MPRLAQLRNAASLAWGTIRAHALRSFLTLLGIVIGVASVVMVGAAIEGLGVYALQSISTAFGTDSFMVAQYTMGGNLTRRDLIEKMKRNRPVRLEDVRLVQATLGDRIWFSPSRQRSGADLKRGGWECEDATIVGVGAEMAEIRDLGIVEGRFFTDQEERASVRAAVIGDEVRESLFARGGSPLGQTFRIDGAEFVVIGMLKKMGTTFGRSQDKVAYVPVTVFNRMYGTSAGVQLYGRPKPASGRTLEEALDETRVVLRNRYHTRPGQPDNFDTRTPDSMRDFIDSVLGIIAAAIVPLTSISLVVGGVVIMNIMLVSVTERTREIGIRKALGARRSDIMLQVLVESVGLSMAGGALGLALAAAATGLASQLLNVPLVITPAYIALALGVSSAVGILSGWYPAARAAGLDPVEALRSE